MTVNIYNSWTGRDFKTLELSEGSAIKDCISGVDWNNAVILCNGNRVNENYVLKETDVVAIRETPSTSFLIGTAIVLAAFGVAELVSYATTGKGLFTNIRDWLMPDVSSNSNKEQSQLESLPTLKGARNQNISGKAVPFIVGQTRISPYKVGTGYHSISGTDGETQRYHQLYVIGYNDIRVGMFKFGETDFAYNGMSESYDRFKGYSLEIGDGTKKGYITDFEQKSPFAKASPELSIADNGEVSGFSVKVTEEGIGKQIINANGSKLKFTRASDRYPRMVEVEIAFNGLISFDDEGNEKDASAEICFGYSTDGGRTFSPFDGKKPGSYYEIVEVDDDDKAAGITGKLLKTKITRKKNKTMRFVASHTFGYGEFSGIETNGNGYVWIRIERADPDSTDVKTSNKAYLAYIRTWVYDKEKSEAKGMYVAQAPIIEKLRDRTTRCGIAIDATENVSDELDELNCMAVAECRTWNSSSGKWSDDKAPTDNPAANALNVMQSGMLGDFAYPDGKIDMYEFGRLHDFCVEKGFSVGSALTSRKKLSEVVDNILIQARAYRIVSGQKYSVFIDKPIYTPACVLNNSNILKDGAGNSKEFKPLPDGFKIKFVNRNIGYDEDEVYVMFNENVSYDDPTAVIESLEMPFVTDPKQVAKNAWFEYGKRKLRPELWKRPVTTEANIIEIGSLVELQDDTIQVGIGNGGWITNVYIKDGMVTGFRISSKINISDLKKSYGARITHSSDNSLPDIRVRKLSVKEAGYSDDFVLDTPVLASDASAPALGDLVSIGEYGRETVSAICLGKKDNGNGRFELSLVPYSAALYSMDSGAKVEFDSKVSSVQKPAIADMKEYVGKTEMLEAISKVVNGIDTSVEPPDKPMVAFCEASRDYVSAGFAALPDADRNTLRNVEWQVNKGHGWEDFASNLSFSARYDFDRRTDGYPEREDLNWQVRCRVTNTRGIASEWSAPLPVDTSKYGTWRVSSAENVYAETVGSDLIRLRFDGGRPDTRQYYGSTRFTVIVKYDGAPIMTKADVPYSLYYYFDRDTDGYPERHENAADGIRDLSLYSFTVRPVETYTGETGEDVTVSADASSYGTWLIPPIETSAEAGEHLVMLRWNMDGAAPYGKTVYDVYLGGEPLKEGATGSYYAYRFTESLTKEEVGALEFSVRARNEAHERTQEFAVDASAYLGYGIDKPWIKAAARREGIDVSWDRTNEFYGKCEFVLLKDGEEVFRSAKEKESFLPFGEGEFPEKDDIAGISLKVHIEGDADTAESDAAETDVSGYLTYIPSVPTAYASASGRNANLSWDSQDGVYGFTGCDIQIAKAYKAADGKMIPVTDADGLEWYAPALGLNPYESLENYKRGDEGGYLEVRGNSVSFSLPLFGQDGGGASDTPYAFRLRGRSAAGKTSEWTEAQTVVCRAISAHDVVKAWDLNDSGERVKLDGALGVNQIFVEELSAISANLGYITDGALKGNAYNYWAVGDVRADDGSMMWRGSFRVGGKDQYILVEPRLKDNAPTGEYDITFVVGNFSVSASGTRISGGALEVYDGKGNLMFSAAPEGSKIRVATGEYNSKETSVDLTDVTFDEIEPCFLTVKDGGDAYVLKCRATGAESYEFAYEVDVYRVGASSYEKVWTIAGWPALSYASVYSFYNYALAEDGKFAIYGLRQNGDSQETGLYVIDIAAKSVRFAPMNVDEDTFQGFNPYKILVVGERLFMYSNKEENGGGTYKTMFMMTEGGIARLFPGEGEFDLLGVAVSGGFAYAAFQTFLFTFVARRDLATGASSFLAFAGAVNSDRDMTECANNIMVDGAHVTLFGKVTVFEDEQTAAEPFYGAVRVPPSAAKWNDWDGVSDFPDDFLLTTGIEAYRFSDFREDTKFLTSPAFLLENDPLVTVFKESEGGIKIDTHRLAFADSDTPAGFLNGTTRGTLEVAQQVESFVLTEAIGLQEYYERYYRLLASIGQYGAAFPQEINGLGAVRVARIKPIFAGTEATDFFVSVLTLFDEQRSEATGSEVFSAGIGFNAISRDTASGKYRYYLDTGAYIEFNEDGTLSAQTGPQGTPGRDGRDGKDGVDGKDGADGAPGRDGKDGTLDIGIAADADVAEDNYAVGTDGDGEVIRTPWSKVWAWIKSKIESVAHSPIVSTLRYSVGGRTGEILNATGDVSSGVKLVIGAGGPTIIGGGESAAAIAAGITTDTEVLHLTSDETVKIQTNIQNGVANAKTTTFNKDGSISAVGPLDIANAASSNSNTPVKAIGGQVAANDYWRIAAGGTSNNGFVEIATADDGTEPIYVRQYSGVFATLVRTLTLLDGSGNTSLPGNLNISSGKQIVLPANSGMWIYGRNNAKIRQSTAAVLWAPIMSIKTKNGSYEIGCCSDNDNLYVRYSTDANFNAGNNNTAEVCTINGDTSANFGGVLSSSKGIKIPTSQPSNLQDGMIWIT